LSKVRDTGSVHNMQEMKFVGQKSTRREEEGKRHVFTPLQIENNPHYSLYWVKDCANIELLHLLC